MRKPRTKHGSCSRKNLEGKKQTPTYTCWQNMLQRCNRQNHPEYPNYGGRGIKVCERWLVFLNFLADMGEKPANLSLDRIDNDGGYNPDNCRWTDQNTQNQNRSNTLRVRVHGETKTIDEWAEESGINRITIDIRLRRGWLPEQAVTVTPAPKKPQSVRTDDSLRLKKA